MIKTCTSQTSVYPSTCPHHAHTNIINFFFSKPCRRVKVPILYQIRPEINAYWSFVILGRSDCRNTKRIGIRSTFVFRFVFIYFFLHNILVIAVSMMINCSSSTFFIQCLLQTLNTIESLVIMIELDWLNSILFLHCIFKKNKQTKNGV